MKKTGIELIAEERQRQLSAEGWTPEHDAQHTDESIALAAAVYATPQNLRSYPSFGIVPFFWPWSANWWKPSPENRIRELQKAGALIAAEIDRIQALEE